MGRMLAAVMVAAAAVTATGAQQIFRSSVDLVHFGVVVTDREGKPVLGLRAEDFEVVEDGRPQTLRFFAGGDPDSAPPLHLGFMIDNSGSMVQDIKDVQTAAIKFLNAVDNVVDVTLTDFDTEVRVARFGPDDFPRLIERIRSRKPDGYTALYDALGVYLNGAAALPGEKILVLYTDGGDTKSSMNKGELIDLLKASDVTVYSIGYLQHQGARKFEYQQILTQLAATTGGQALFPTSIRELDGMYDRILREIAGRYSLGYLSSNEKMDGTWRDVRIRLVNRPDLKNVKIRTRAGYWAPYRPDTFKQR
ncbi:MAG TPA: VWA domain-containing protein [Vicinamibacterales bacterium]|nr:VWA domain-containing protein [Vicinamibacterales bacterium]